MDPDLLAQDPRLTALVEKERGFTEDDKSLLRSVELELLARVVPAYREASARGQIELATSPFYHPILPLLCDSDAHRVAQPGSPKPRPVSGALATRVCKSLEPSPFTKRHSEAGLPGCGPLRGRYQTRRSG